MIFERHIVRCAFFILIKGGDLLRYIDITMPLKLGMVTYPGDPAVDFKTVLSISNGAAVNLTQYSFGSHSGTHFDPPYHTLSDGKTADAFAADYFIGRAKVFEFLEGDIDLKNLRHLHIEKTDMVLFKTRSTNMNEKDFDSDHAAITPSAAEYLVQKHVHAVGIDYLSVDRHDAALAAHTILLRAGIPIIEGLNLSDAQPGIYKMIAMFMLIENSDGAPIRAILEKV